MGKASRTKQAHRRYRCGLKRGPADSGISLTVPPQDPNIFTAVHVLRIEALDLMHQVFSLDDPTSLQNLVASTGPTAEQLFDMRFRAERENGEWEAVGICELAFLYGAERCVMEMLELARDTEVFEATHLELLKFLIPIMHDDDGSARHAMSLRLAKRLMAIMVDEFPLTWSMFTLTVRDVGQLADCVREVNSEKLAAAEQTSLHQELPTPVGRQSAGAVRM